MHGVCSMTRHWFQADVYLHHQGAGSDYSIPAFIFAVDAVSAFKRTRYMPGAKFYQTRKGFPNVIPLDEKQSSELEKEIIGAGISLRNAKNSWYISQQTVGRYSL